MKRVVISGIGIHSCLGSGVEMVNESLKNGVSGIGIDPKRTEYGYASPLTGIVEKPNLKGILDRKQRLYLSEEGEYAYIATSEALQSAGITTEYAQHNVIGIIYGNDSSTGAIVEAHEAAKANHQTMMMGQSAVFKTMNSNVSMNLSVLFHLTGINFTVSAACASSSHAIGLALALIREGWQEMIVCGGAQEVNTYSMASFDAINAFSKRIDAPAKASRPFDKNRDGLVPSGGAATLVIEEYEHAVKRGAFIYGEIIGYGFSSNGESIVLPNAASYQTAMQNALTDAQIKAENIDFINSHATSTILGDAEEAKAIHVLFNSTPVCATKSMTGHECWMAGASEAIYSILMMNNDFLAPTINYEEGDEYSSLLNIHTKKTEQNSNCFLSNSFGFGGTNSCLIIRKVVQ